MKLLSEATERLDDDPLGKFIGAFQSSISDWTDHHDKYLGQSVKDSMTNNRNGITLLAEFSMALWKV